MAIYGSQTIFEQLEYRLSLRDPLFFQYIDPKTMARIDVSIMYWIMHKNYPESFVAW